MCVFKRSQREEIKKKLEERKKKHTKRLKLAERQPLSIGGVTQNTQNILHSPLCIREGKVGGVSRGCRLISESSNQSTFLLTVTRTNTHVFTKICIKFAMSSDLFLLNIPGNHGSLISCHIKYITQA